MNAAPHVSLIVCTRSRAAYLQPALEALAKIRSRLDWEVLLVDNASTDNTADLIRAADDCGGRLHYLYAPRPGLGAARDFAWRKARGQILSFTDDDCYPAPDYIDAVWNAFARRTEGCLGGRILLFDTSDFPITIDEGTAPRTLPARSFIPAGELQGANLSFRREVLEAIGGFDPQLGAGTPFPCEDVDAVAATSWAGFEVGFDPAPVVYHHHRRKSADIPRLSAAYDRGRGAYFMKYLLRPDSRAKYAKAWLAKIVNPKGLLHLVRIYREISGALTYALSRYR